ncbi:MAG: hypothetical protein HQK51_19270 [Oligoflexia bacterium]|nr:hypothetical protein [Oligoflexia bacterium]
MKKKFAFMLSIVFCLQFSAVLAADRGNVEEFYKDLKIIALKDFSVTSELFSTMVYNKKITYLNISRQNIQNTGYSLETKEIIDMGRAIGDQLGFLDISGRKYDSDIAGDFPLYFNTRNGSVDNANFETLKLVYAWGFPKYEGGEILKLCYITSRNYALNNVIYNNVKVIGTKIEIADPDFGSLNCQNL